MKYHGKTRRRPSIRLVDYDYSLPGAYFVTVCAKNRLCLFGAIDGGTARLDSLGDMVRSAWDALPDHYPHVRLGTSEIMPNHVHGVILLTDSETRFHGHNPTVASGRGFESGLTVDIEPVGAGLKPAPTLPKRHALPEIVRAFKTFSSRRINALRGTTGTAVWQRGYYERVIRSEEELNRITQYILDNPGAWETDPENPLVEVATSGKGAGMSVPL